MSRWALYGFIIGALASACVTTSVAQDLHPAADAKGFVTLFDGQNLDAWQMGPDRSWTIVDGEIRLEREFDGQEHNADYLWTREQYGDFVLDLECRFPQRANSGIFLRTSDLRDPVYSGIEVQVTNSHGRTQTDRGGTAGAIYDCLAPTENAVLPPDQWNRFTITCAGPHITVILNGKQIIDMDLDRWTQPRQNPDASRNKFPVALRDFARRGHIGLQDHGRPVAYRNIRVKRLDPVYSLKAAEDGMVLENPRGQLVLQYLTRKPAGSALAANSTSCFHPVHTPAGIRVTDLAPGDHHHHRGVFLAWHAMQFQWPMDFSSFGPRRPTSGLMIDRADFWGWGQHGPTEGCVIKNRDVQLVAADADHARLQIVDDWTVHDQTMMTQVMHVDVREVPDAYVVDLDYMLTPVADKELVLHPSSFGGFCVRARNDGQSYYADADGEVQLPDPWFSEPQLNWPARRWYDFTITLHGDNQQDNGRTVGCAVVDHPDNPPATWHNPRYIWMINPCIVAAGPVTATADAPLRLRYRLVIHDGPTPRALIEELAEGYR